MSYHQIPTITRRQGRYAGSVALAGCKQLAYGILFAAALITLFTVYVFAFGGVQ